MSAHTGVVCAAGANRAIKAAERERAAAKEQSYLLVENVIGFVL